MPKKLTKEEFVAKAREKHGNKYNYDKVVYNGANEKVTITCPVHGDFPITPSNHRAGRGCPECAKKQRAKAVARARTMTKEDFVGKAMKKHNGKYNYSLVDISGNCHTKVKIICNKCGTIFPQRINDHLNGCGCPECANRKRIETVAEMSRITKEEFITRARKKHGNKYDYSLTEIKGNSKTKVKIICNKCGTRFQQRIEFHLSGGGCPECANRNRAITKEEFITRARKKHGNKYDYSLIDSIKNRKSKVKIICNKCGTEFTQQVSNHLNGHGCQKCKQSHLENKTTMLLEQNKVAFEPQKKFPWLKSNKNWKMPLDFYLPEYSVAIECQGEQHYMGEGRGYFTKDILYSIQQRDKLKYSLCQEHGIQVYYINYNDNVEDKFNNILNEINFKN